MVLLTSIFAFTFGLVTVALAPYMAKMVEVLVNSIPKIGGDSNLSEGVINKYREMATVTLASPAVLCVKRSNGGFDWVPARRDGDKLVTRLSGEEREFKDPLGNGGRLYGKIFGLVHEDNNILLSPSDLSVAERYIEKSARDEEVIKAEDGTFTGEKSRARYAYTGFAPAGSRYVNVDIFPDVVRGNCDPRAALRVEEFVRKMYQEFNSTAIWDKVIILMAYGAGVGSVFLLWKFVDATAGAGSGTTIPLYLGGVLW